MGKLGKRGALSVGFDGDMFAVMGTYHIYLTVSRFLFRIQCTSSYKNNIATARAALLNFNKTCGRSDYRRVSASSKDPLQAILPLPKSLLSSLKRSSICRTLDCPSGLQRHHGVVFATVQLESFRCGERSDHLTRNERTLGRS